MVDKTVLTLVLHYPMMQFWITFVSYVYNKLQGQSGVSA